MALDREYAAMGSPPEALQPARGVACLQRLRPGLLTAPWAQQFQCAASLQDVAKSELTPQGREAARISGERRHSGDSGSHFQVLCGALRNTAEEVLRGLVRRTEKSLLRPMPGCGEIELSPWEGLPLEEIPRRFPDNFWLGAPGRASSDAIDQWRSAISCSQPLFSCGFVLESCPHHLRWQVRFAGYAQWNYPRPHRLCPRPWHGALPQFPAIQLRRQPTSLFTDSRQARLELLNDTAHLGELLPKLKEGRPRGALAPYPGDRCRPCGDRHFAAALQGVAIDKLLAAGPIARLAAVGIFQRSADSCRTISSMP